MKETAKAKLNREVNIDYDTTGTSTRTCISMAACDPCLMFVVSADEFDDEKELQALEAEIAAERHNGEKLQNLLTLTQPTGNALAAGQLAPLPSNETLFGKIHGTLIVHPGLVTLLPFQVTWPTSVSNTTRSVRNWKSSKRRRVRGWIKVWKRNYVSEEREAGVASRRSCLQKRSSHSDALSFLSCILSTILHEYSHGLFSSFLLWKVMALHYLLSSYLRIGILYQR